MNTREGQLDRLEQALIRAHKGTRAPELGDMFTNAVMARIRNGEADFASGIMAADNVWDKILLPFACSCAGTAAVMGVLGWAAFQGMSLTLLGSAMTDTTSMLNTWPGLF